MEMTKYSMWTKRRHGLVPHLKPAASMYDDSWEEQAFAEDAAGPLGGCIWPPRSYSCSFCRREFRSAQALGGHMNVHRRDRARLKQSPIPHGEVLHSDNQNHHNLIDTSFTPMGFRYQPHQVYNALFCNPNPNSDPGVLLPLNSPPACGVSSDPPQESNQTKKISVSSFPATIVNENPKKASIPSLNEPALVMEDYCHIGRPMSSITQTVDEAHRAKRDHLVGTDAPARLNLFVQTMPAQSVEKDKERCSKKRKIEDTSRTTFFLRSNGVARDRFRPLEVLEQSPSPKEELDLELRLGSPPEVKL